MEKLLGIKDQKVLLGDQSFDLGENLTVHLKTFRREQARKWWDEIQKAGEIRVECNSIGK